ncbi:MAG: hypothetical protein HY253_05785 [Burkholderiales bacterium]|nr:hypothetical protein [Burkholderiales bacterium]
MSNRMFRTSRKARSSVEFGLTLVAVGTIFLLAKFDYINLRLHWWLIASVCVSGFGLLALIRAKTAGETVSALFQIFIGVWLYLCFEKVWGFNFSNSWPWMLIAYGASHVLAYFFKREE